MKARSDISTCVFREAAENLQQVGRQGGLVLPTWHLAQEFKDYALWGGETVPHSWYYVNHPGSLRS